MIEVRTANLDDLAHQQAVVALLNMYASEPMGGSKPLPSDVQQRLIPGLREQPNGHHFLAYDADAAIGLAICFRGFSTFNARPILNIHDLAVVPEVRGRGVGRQLLAAVEEQATSLGCCAITLEVRADNTIARGLYERFGFEPGEPTTDAMSFWRKTLGSRQIQSSGS